MGRLIDMERKRCESTFHGHDLDLRVTMVGRVNLPNSEWGGRRVVDISSSVYKFIRILIYEISEGLIEFLVEIFKQYFAEK